MPTSQSDLDSNKEVEEEEEEEEKEEEDKLLLDDWDDWILKD